MITKAGKNLAYIYSTPRSGSTLLAAMLGGHDNVYVPPEPWFLLLLHSLLSSDDAIVAHYDENLARRAFRELSPENIITEASQNYALTVYNSLLEKNKKKYFVDKTPRYYHVLEWIDTLFPEAKKILLVRNPLDIFASYKDVWGIEVEEMIGEQPSPFSFDATIAYFRFQDFYKRSHTNMIRISYENLVIDPHTVMHGVCSFLGLAFNERMISYGENKELLTWYANSSMGDRKVLSEIAPHRKSCGKWKTILTPMETQKIVTTLGTRIFEENGYKTELQEALLFASLQYEKVDREGRKEELFKQYQTYVETRLSSSTALSNVALTRKNEELLKYITTIEKDRQDRLEAILRYQEQLDNSRNAIEQKEKRIQQLLEETLGIQDQLLDSRDAIKQKEKRIQQLLKESLEFQNQLADSRDAIEQKEIRIQQLLTGTYGFQNQLTELRDVIAQIEKDRQARLDSILYYQKELAEVQRRNQELIDTISSIENDRRARLESILYYQTVLSDLQHRYDVIEKDHANLLMLVETLNGHIAELGTLETSLRRFIELSLRSIGLYDFILRHRKKLNQVFLFVLHAGAGLASVIRKFHRKRELGVVKADTAPLQKQTLKETLNSPEVNAYVNSRLIQGDLEDSVIHHFLDNNSSFSSVICLMPDPNDLQLLIFLKELGKSVFVLHSPSENLSLIKPNISFTACIADGWFMKYGRPELSKYDVLFIGKNCSHSYFQLLKNYVSPRTAMILHNTSFSEELFLLEGRIKVTIGSFVSLSPCSNSKGLFKVSEERRTIDGTQWPWKQFKSEIPSTMPSGRPWPRISVVTATLNQGDFLEEAIRSVLLQRYPNLEYILLDGGSTDTTPEILNRYKNEFAVCLSQKDKGQADALNRGFHHATGEILAWLNSDDRYLPNTFLDVALAFDTYACDMVAGGCALVNNNEVIPWSVHHTLLPLGEKVRLPLDNLLDIDGSWQKGDFFYQPEVFWSRNIWEKAGRRIDSTLHYSMDYELWVRMAIAEASIVHIPETLAYFRMHQRQKTSGKDLPFLPELRKLNKRLLKELRKK